eukprot:COSAG04_NODE_1383_length_6988_cov_36.194658_3_plen_405_part_00
MLFFTRCSLHELHVKNWGRHSPQQVSTRPRPHHTCTHPPPTSPGPRSLANGALDVACADQAVLPSNTSCMLTCTAGYTLSGTQPSCSNGTFAAGNVSCAAGWARYLNVTSGTVDEPTLWGYTAEDLQIITLVVAVVSVCSALCLCGACPCGPNKEEAGFPGAEEFWKSGQKTEWWRLVLASLAIFFDAFEVGAGWALIIGQDQLVEAIFGDGELSWTWANVGELLVLISNILPLIGFALAVITGPGVYVGCAITGVDSSFELVSNKFVGFFMLTSAFKPLAQPYYLATETFSKAEAKWYRAIFFLIDKFLGLAGSLLLLMDFDEAVDKATQILALWVVAATAVAAFFDIADYGLDDTDALDAFLKQAKEAKGDFDDLKQAREDEKTARAAVKKERLNQQNAGYQ